MSACVRSNPGRPCSSTGGESSCAWQGERDDGGRDDDGRDGGGRDDGERDDGERDGGGRDDDDAASGQIMPEHMHARAHKRERGLSGRQNTSETQGARADGLGRARARRGRDGKAVVARTVCGATTSWSGLMGAIASASTTDASILVDLTAHMHAWHGDACR